MAKSNLVLLQPLENVESVESKAMEGIKYGVQGIIEAQTIMRKKMSKKECDAVFTRLLIGSLEIIQQSFNLQPGELEKLLNK